jgi:hypothetical protein
VNASACPGCGEQLSKTQDPHIAWDVASEQCNRCETAAYTQLVRDGEKDGDARKAAAKAGRLWIARAVPTPPE